MQADQILAQLNEQQREAVTSSGCNVMVVAGAGSGKQGFWSIELHGLSR